MSMYHMLFSYFELNNDERSKLSKCISKINIAYKAYCILIDTDIDGSNDPDITIIFDNILPLIENNLEKLIYNGFEFLTLCMSKVKDTDIRHPCEFFNNIFNEDLYDKYLSELIEKRDKNIDIDKLERQYYSYFIKVELIKIEWLNQNYEDLRMESVIKYNIEQFRYKYNLNKYIEEQMKISITIIESLYEHLKYSFPGWKVELAQCKDINFSHGNPMKLCFNGIEYIKND